MRAPEIPPPGLQHLYSPAGNLRCFYLREHGGLDGAARGELKRAPREHLARQQPQRPPPAGRIPHLHCGGDRTSPPLLVQQEEIRLTAAHHCRFPAASRICTTVTLKGQTSTVPHVVSRFDWAAGAAAGLIVPLHEDGGRIAFSRFTPGSWVGLLPGTMAASAASTVSGRSAK